MITAIAADRFPACLEFTWRTDEDGQPQHVTPGDSGGPTACGVTLETYAGYRKAHRFLHTAASDLKAATQAGRPRSFAPTSECRSPGRNCRRASICWLASKSSWGTLAVAAVAWVSARYGIGLDETTCSLIGGVAVIVGSYLMRLLTKQPIAAVVSTLRASPATACCSS